MRGIADTAAVAQPRPSAGSLRSWVRVVRPGPAGELAIGARKIYILPTRYGWVFGLLLLLMLIGAVNYGNNPAFLLTFLLAGLGSNGIYLTWRNLKGLRLYPAGCEPVFAGQTARFRFRLEDPEGRERPALQVGFADGEAVVRDVPADAATVVELRRPTAARGRLPAGRVVLSTRYPLGLLNAWCYLEPDAECLVYPRPAATWRPPADAAYGGAEQGDRGVGADDFIGLRGFRPGDPPGRIDWRALAREQGLLTKQFGGDRAEQLWLDWEETPGSDTEQRLSLLARAMLDAEHAGARYGLRLGRRVHAPDGGSRHLAACLRSLALYPEGT